jgi:outer membrane protein TolC
MDAELALHSAAERPDADARIKIYRDHLDRVRQIEKLLEQSFKAGQVTKLDVEEATYHRLDAEILLVQAGGKLP